MKNFLWAFVVLAGLFTSCQSGKLYSGAASWGSYSKAELPASAGPAPAIAETKSVASGQASQSVQPEERKGNMATYPVFFASSENTLNDLTNRPEMTVSLQKAKVVFKVNPGPVQIAQPRQMHKLAVAGLATSALAFLPFVLGISLFFSLPLALAGAWMSRRAIRQINAERDNYRGLALAKAGLGIAVIMLGLLLLFGAAALVVG